jgi:predicted transcriptional regulator
VTSQRAERLTVELDSSVSAHLDRLKTLTGRTKRSVANRALTLYPVLAIEDEQKLSQLCAKTGQSEGEVVAKALTTYLNSQ